MLGVIEMWSKLLDLFAPKARAQVDLTSQSYEDLITDFNSKFKLVKQNCLAAKYRVQGDFFSNVEATQVVFGETANPKHYSKVGFDLILSKCENGITLVAEERVIFGYLELNAVGVALEERLNSLAVNYT